MSYVVKKFPESVCLNSPEYLLDGEGGNILKFESEAIVLDFLNNNGIKVTSVENAEDEFGLIIESYEESAEVWEDITIPVFWSLGDIKAIIEEDELDIIPSKENCECVSNYLSQTHDAEIGINWDVIRNALSECFPDSK